MKRGRLLEIIDTIKAKNNLQLEITAQSICQRMRQENPLSIGRGGLVSPLLPVESTIVSVIIPLARIWECINPTTDILMFNSLITDTPIQ